MNFCDVCHLQMIRNVTNKFVRMTDKITFRLEIILILVMMHNNSQYKCQDCNGRLRTI